MLNGETRTRVLREYSISHGTKDETLENISHMTPLFGIDDAAGE